MIRHTFSLSSLLALILSAGAWGCGGGNPAAPGGDRPTPDVGGEPEAPDVGADVVDEEIDDGTCAQGESRCVDRIRIEICDADGLTWRPERCRGEERCDEEAQACLQVVCVAGDILGCADERSIEVCNQTGTRTFTAPCPASSACVDDQCEVPLCQQGQTRCAGLEAIETCGPGGTFGAPEPCPLGKQCDAGECKELCELNKKVSSYIGCEYWSLDLDNFDDAIGQPHAIVVSNPNPELTANITITRPNGAPVPHEGPASIPPLGLGIYQMPTDSDISVIEISDKAFVVTSNIPVTAHQFNPLNNVDVFSNDASLLLPTNTLGTEYIVTSWEQRTTPPLRGFLTVVNTSGQDNEVTVTVACNTAPGPQITRMTAGETRTFSLGPGQVLNIETANGGDDLTGSIISATQPIGVFGGHECANVVVGIDRCDHIESQLFPVNTWGTTYLGTKFFPRGAEDDIWRVMGSEDNTVVTLDPPPLDELGRVIDRLVINRGEFVQLETAGHFLLNASKPVSLAHYMVGSNWFGIPRICDTGVDAGNPTGIGDPALSIAVPLNQYRADYIVLVPLDYDQDYLNIMIVDGTSVFLDGAPVPPNMFEPIGLTGHSVARVLVEDGPHTLTGSAPFGLEAYGYDCHVSYAYPGGLNLEIEEER